MKATKLDSSVLETSCVQGNPKVIPSSTGVCVVLRTIPVTLNVQILFLVLGARTQLQECTFLPHASDAGWRPS